MSFEGADSALREDRHAYQASGSRRLDASPKGDLYRPGRTMTAEESGMLDEMAARLVAIADKARADAAALQHADFRRQVKIRLTELLAKRPDGWRDLAERVGWLLKTRWAHSPRQLLNATSMLGEMVDELLVGGSADAKAFIERAGSVAEAIASIGAEIRLEIEGRISQAQSELAVLERHMGELCQSKGAALRDAAADQDLARHEPLSDTKSDELVSTVGDLIAEMES